MLERICGSKLPWSFLMLKTLQLYVTRELLKTFALTAVGLTLTFSLCGGVLNMIQAEVLTTVQMVRVLGFILPVALTLTLPVSALFACAIVYGRLAADNEIDACKASGVNIHRLFAPAMGLSICTALFTFAFTNYVLPNFIARLDALVRKDMEKIVIHALNTRGYVRKAPYVVYARDANLRDEDGHKVIDIHNAAFLELEGENLRSCGTADAVRVDFHTKTGEGNPSVQASMFNVRGMDLKRNQFYQLEEQPIHSVEIPSTMRQKPKWLTLPRLINYRRDPAALPEIQEQLDGMRMQIREASFYQYLLDQWRGPEKVIRLRDEHRSYEIRAERTTQDANDFKPELLQVRITQQWESHVRTYKADRCSVKFKRGFAGGPNMAQFFLRDHVSFTDSRDPQNAVEMREIDLEEVAVPAEAELPATQLSNRQILGLPSDPNEQPHLIELQKGKPKPLGLGERIEHGRVSTRKDVVKLALDIAGIIHSRLAFSVSVLVTLILAAGLGIIYRGGQLLTAFVISFAPGLLVVVMNIMGRQLAENFGTHLIGIIVIWAGIGLVAIADAIVLTKYLRR